MLEQTPLPPLDTFEDYEVFIQAAAPLEAAAHALIKRHALPDAPLTRFSEGTNVVFALGDALVIKIFPPFHRDQYAREAAVLHSLLGKLPLSTPEILHQGEISGWPYIIMTQLEGTLLETLWDTLSPRNKESLLAELGLLIQQVHALPTQGLEAIDSHWGQFMKHQIAGCVAHHRAHNLPEGLLAQIPAFLEEARPMLFKAHKPVILTGEYTPMNLLVKEMDGIWHLHGVIDFGDAMLGSPAYDLLGPAAFLIQGDRALMRTFLISYGYDDVSLNQSLSRYLTALLLLHQYSNLSVQVRIDGWQERVNTLNDLADLVWGF
ncbi:MAG: aminoglycoside phosphotransferase family protein [Proteobacteria bacterium]|nr:aminoglycoside phosphotransferase family protein [Pseudomonadota bacterium]